MGLVVAMQFPLMDTKRADTFQFVKFICKKMEVKIGPYFYCHWALFIFESWKNGVKFCPRQHEFLRDVAEEQAVGNSKHAEEIGS